MSIKQEKLSKKKKEKEYPLEVVGEIHYEDHPDIITHLIVEDIDSGRRFAATTAKAPAWTSPYTAQSSRKWSRSSCS